MLSRRLCLVLTLCLIPESILSAPAAPVIVTTLIEQPLIETIEALGTLQSNQALTLSATVTDTVRAIHFNDGQRVNKHTVLVEMTSDEEHAELQQARFALEEAERQYLRVKSLAETNLATASLLDERRHRFQSAQSTVQAMQSRMADRLIIAPFAGVLGMRDISLGALVSPGDPIATLDDDSSMKLDMTLSAVYLSVIKSGIKISAQSREIPGKEFLGEIVAIDSRIDINTRAVLVRARLPNPARELKSGMLMTVTLHKPPINSLLLPELALVQEGFRSYVYRIIAGDILTVEKVAVTTGTRQAGKVVITAGLAAGDRIVTQGVMRLKPGVAVQIIAQEQGGESLSELLAPTEQGQ